MSVTISMLFNTQNPLRKLQDQGARSSRKCNVDGVHEHYWDERNANIGAFSGALINRISLLFLIMVLGSAFLVTTPEMSAAQQLNQQDLSGVQAEDISDEELRRFIRRAEAEGISESEAMDMARERGMAQSEIEQLRRRIEELDMEELEEVETDTVDARRETLADERDTIEVDEEHQRIFGYSLFTEHDMSFEPSVNIATPRNYQLGAGDELVIDIWGQTENTYRLEVNNEGNINLENLGPIQVNGLTIEEADERIMNHLQQIYSGLREGAEQDTWAQVSLGRVRSIQVTLMGEINAPGTYTLSSLATVFNALYQSGGPNPNGSFRKIQVIRDNEVAAELDMYDFLVHGDQSENIRLQDQDVIKVDPYVNRVEIEGMVKRPGVYETTEGETLEQLLRYAGDFGDDAYTRQVNVHRNTPTQRAIISVKDEGFGDFEMASGDSVHVDEILDRYENRVEIEGAVWRPGEYELAEDMMLSDLIEEADGLRPDAFRSRGVIYRLRDDFSTEVVAFNVGNVVENPEDYDVPLRADDEIRIPTIFDMREEFFVNIRGAVQQPDRYEFRENMTLEDLILEADGFLESASEAKIEVARRIDAEPAPEFRSNQISETYSFEINRNLELDPEARDFTLQPFDQVFVRRKPDYQEQVLVEIDGQVMYPGEYSLETRNERISDLIERAGGLTDEAYPDGATLIRQRDAEERPEVDFDIFATEDQEITVDNDMEESRVGIDLVAIMENPGSVEDIYLREGDEIRIPEEMQTVRVSGAVMRETEVRYRDGFSYRDYIDQAGGYTENARQRRGYVLYANGDMDRRRSFLYITSSPEIKPGAEIVVPERPERERLSTGEIVSISSAVVSMATSIIVAIDRIYD